MVIRRALSAQALMGHVSRLLTLLVYTLESWYAPALQSPFSQGVPRPRTAYNLIRKSLPSDGESWHRILTLRNQTCLIVKEKKRKEAFPLAPLTVRAAGGDCTARVHIFRLQNSVWAQA